MFSETSYGQNTPESSALRFKILCLQIFWVLPNEPFKKWLQITARILLAKVFSISYIQGNVGKMTWLNPQKHQQIARQDELIQISAAARYWGWGGNKPKQHSAEQGKQHHVCLKVCTRSSWRCITIPMAPSGIIAPGPAAGGAAAGTLVPPMAPLLFMPMVPGKQSLICSKHRGSWGLLIAPKPQSTM